MRAMKDSGIEWIGEIPEGWKIARIKQLATEDGTQISDGDWIESPYIQNEGIRYLTTGNIGDGFFKEQGSGFISKETFDELGCTRVIKGDLIFSRLNLPIGRACIIPEKYQEAVIAVDNVLLRPDKIHNKRYIVYITMCSGYQEMNALVARGTTMQRMSRTQLQNVFIPCPLPTEQTAIANYLDKKCAAIDTVIEKEQQVIKKLIEYKQSVITEAVTKGLNPDVPMKDSGIEWIGEIPTEWGLVKFAYLAEIGDIDHKMPNSVDSGIPYVMTGDLSDKASNIKFDKCKQISKDDYLNLSRKIYPEEGDIIFARYATIGAVCFVDISLPFLVSYSCVIIKPSSKINGKFLYYYLKSSVFEEEARKYTNSNTQGNVGIEQMYKIKIVVPSLPEQTAITDYLDKKCASIDTVIAKKQQLIDKLTEYKKSLIYEMVTGKKEVPLC